MLFHLFFALQYVYVPMGGTLLKVRKQDLITSKPAHHQPMVTAHRDSVIQVSDSVTGAVSAIVNPDGSLQDISQEKAAPPPTPPTASRTSRKQETPVKRLTGTLKMATTPVGTPVKGAVAEETEMEVDADDDCVIVGEEHDELESDEDMGDEPEGFSLSKVKNEPTDEPQPAPESAAPNPPAPRVISFITPSWDQLN